MKSYEVELRALISEEDYHRLKEHFDGLSQGTVNDAETYTFLTPSYNIKVKNQISKGSAKITVKKGAEYEQDVHESELPIAPEDVSKAVSMITALGFEKHIPSLQQRIDYHIRDIVVSLKHETNWKYHIEAEIVVDKENKVKDAKEKLYNFFKDLGITPMTEEETRTLVNSILVKYDMDLI